MAERSDAKDAILDEIVTVLGYDISPSTKAQAVKDLAEAYAWLISPAQPHGASTTVEK